MRGNNKLCVCVTVCRPFTILLMPGCLLVDQILQGSFVWRSITTTLSLYLVCTVYTQKHVCQNPSMYCHTFFLLHTHTHTHQDSPCCSRWVLILDGAIHFRFSRYTAPFDLTCTSHCRLSIFGSDLTICMDLLKFCKLFLNVLFVSSPSVPSQNVRTVQQKPKNKIPDMKSQARITALLVCSLTWFPFLKHVWSILCLLWEGWQEREIIGTEREKQTELPSWIWTGDVVNLRNFTGQLSFFFRSQA